MTNMTPTTRFWFALICGLAVFVLLWILHIAHLPVALLIGAVVFVGRWRGTAGWR